MRLLGIRRFSPQFNSLSPYLSRFSRLNTYTLTCLLLLTTIGSFSWLFFVKTDEVVSANGSLQPISSVDVVTSSVDGVVDQIPVKNGSLVRDGELLLQIDSSSTDAQLADSQVQLRLSKVNLQRLEKELDLGKRSFDAYLQGLKIQLYADQQSLDAFSKVYAQGASSRLSVVAQQAKVAKLQADLDRARLDQLKQRDEYMDKISSVRSKISTLKKDIHVYEDKLQLSQIRSPISGFVFDIEPSNVGYMVSAGSPLMRITPLDDLQAVVQIPSSRLGDFALGQEVNISIKSFNSLQAGTLKGFISYISSDAIESDDSRKESYFNANISLQSQTYLNPSGDFVHLRPGLSLVASIKLRSATYFAILFDSLFQK